MRADELRIPVLPTDSAERKNIPIFSGVINYFPLALAAVARVSKRGNDKHNPGQPLHHARGKSMDHEDCIARHLIDVDTIDPVSGEYEDAQSLAWRALAKLQVLEEKRLGKPIARGASEPEMHGVTVPFTVDVYYHHTAHVVIGEVLDEDDGEEIEIVEELEPLSGSPETIMVEDRASGAV